MKPTVNMFWVGRTMGPLHAACLRSFLRHDVDVVLHCYAEPDDVPAGVALFDAARIMPQRDLAVHRRSGSAALGANRYRYRIIEAGMGLYADCDVYCLHPPMEDAAYVLGKEDGVVINNAVLNYPPGSPLSQMLLAATQDEYVIPAMLKPSEKLLLQVRKRIGAPKSVRDHQWGVWGPRLLTHAVGKLGLRDKAAPIDIYYPVHPRNVSLLREPGLSVADLATPRTRFVHLWHKLLDKAPPPDGSPLAEILRA